MEIKILKHRKAIPFLVSEPKKWDVLFLSNPDDKYGIEGSETIVNLAKEYCELLFYDVCFPVGRMGPPTLEDVQKALDFGNGKENLLVTCHGGVSRSSAIAYLIAASRVGGQRALDILDPNIHEPNSLIIKYGEQILGLPVMELVDNWKNLANALDLDTLS